MYNRYIPSGSSYARVTQEGERGRQGGAHPPGTAGPGRQQGPSAGQRRPQHGPTPRGGPSPGVADPLRLLAGGERGTGLSGLLKGLNLEGLDSGDVLLLLIILLVFLEGDNLELVITLGLMLLLGLGDEGEKDQNS